MNITKAELLADGFRRAGTVYPDAVTTLRLHIDPDEDVHGFAVYIMVVNHEVVKAGKTETPFSTRMKDTFGSLRRKMTDRAEHPRYQEKTFKEHAQATIRANQEIELWVQAFESRGEMMAKEQALNDRYRGVWTKEYRGR
jgi:hypothetical protein